MKLPILLLVLVAGCAREAGTPTPRTPATSQPTETAASEPPPAIAAPRAGATGAPGKGEASVEELTAVIEQKVTPMMKECFNRSLKDHPRMAGRIVYAVRIAADGHVEKVDVQSNDGIAERSVTCGRVAVLGVRFPAQGEGGTRVAMPFSLKRVAAEFHLR